MAPIFFANSVEMKRMFGPVLLFLFVQTVVISENCLSRDYGNGGTVCVCSSDNCTTLEAVEQPCDGEYVTYTSNLDGLRFELAKGDLGNGSDENVITVDRNNTGQTIFGFGGAFTDATGINILNLTQDLQGMFMESYYCPLKGIACNVGRVPVACTDFSTRAYTYNDKNDSTLSNFSLTSEDYEYKIPFIKTAMNLSGNLQLFASAWPAPPWMKTNEAYSGDVLNFLNPTYYQTFANYLVKFLEKYNEEGFTFWGITTGNEPFTSLLGTEIPSVSWVDTQMKIWIRDYLGPTIRNSNFSDIKLLALDDQRFFLPNVDLMLADSEFYEYVDGIAVHWYTDKIIPASWLSDTHNKFPEKFLLATEACSGSQASDPKVLLGSWDRAEDYATSIIEDINNYVTGWVDWNMALDTEGGPTFISNFVDSPIIVNATANEFYKQPMYYALGHVSKFVPRGSVKIATTSFSDDVLVTAFETPESGIVVVIMNKDSTEVTVNINDSEQGSTPLLLTARSITTMLYS